MKRFICFMIVLFAMLVFTSAAQSQILKRFKDKVQQKVEDKVEQKVDRKIDQAAEEMVEKSWNSIFGEGFSHGDSSGGFSIPFNSNVTTEESYLFDVVTTMEIQQMEPGGDRQPPTLMRMHFSESEQYTGTQILSEETGNNEDEMTIIYDFKHEAMIMLMNGDDGKHSIAFDLNRVADITGQVHGPAEQGEQIESEPVPDFKNLGTKNIAGLRCEGYLTEDASSKTEIWVAPDQNAGFHRMFRANASAKQLQGKIPDNYPGGMVMEMTYEELDSGRKTLLQVTDIDYNAGVSFSMNDYPGISMGN